MLELLVISNNKKLRTLTYLLMLSNNTYNYLISNDLPARNKVRKCINKARKLSVRFS